MSQIKKCNSCGQESLIKLIDLGPQAICHHFLKSETEKEYVHNITLGQCEHCATIQLIDRIPIKEMIPRYDWLTCTEPEDHLDDLVQTICHLPGISKDSQIGGISFKDDSTLERFNQCGFKNTWRADLYQDLGCTDSNAGFESVQFSFTRHGIDRLISKYGKSDIFIARHVIEHAYDLRQFIQLSKQLIKPEGYIIFEIPDCQKAFESYDYTSIWDQHTIYFTGKTFRNCFQLNGLSVVHFEQMSYSIEDSYVGIAKIDESRNASLLSDEELKEEIQRGKRFADEFTNTKKKLNGYFNDYRQDHGKVAIFGGGHMSCTFLNLFDLKDHVEFVVDDNPNMRGLFMPGSRLPVLESQAVYDRDINLCLLTLSAISEEKVIKKNQKFLERGGTFFSVFPGSKWAMNI